MFFVKVFCRSTDRNGTYSWQSKAARLRNKILQIKVSSWFLDMYISDRWIICRCISFQAACGRAREKRPQGISRSKPKSFKSCRNLSILWISVQTDSNSALPFRNIVPSSCSSSKPLSAAMNWSYSDYGAESNSLFISSYCCSTCSIIPSVPPPLPCLGRILIRLNNGIFIKVRS